MNEREKLAELARKAFYSVMNSVVCPDTIKREAFNLFLNGYALEKYDDSREAEYAIFKTIGQTDWQWPDFEKWRDIFSRANEWPRSWLSSDLELPELIVPHDIQGIAKLMLVTDMRKVLKRYNVEKPPISKDEVRLLFEQKVPYGEAVELFSDRLKELKERHQEKQKNGKIYLLTGDIIRAWYFQRGTQNYKDDDGLVWEMYGMGDEVDEKYTKQIMESITPSTSMKVPLFPGNSVSIRPMLRSHYEFRQERRNRRERKGLLGIIGRTILSLLAGRK
ncbi:MAG: hypothetical protein LBI35_01175 [Burkholderiales bacterium]|nr:hypothetical protein [Burkholderiales bacterium]